MESGGEEEESSETIFFVFQVFKLELSGGKKLLLLLSESEMISAMKIVG